MAETFLIRIEHLPPLNFNREHISTVDGYSRYLNRSHAA